MNGRSCALSRCPPTNPDLGPSSASERGAQGRGASLKGRGRRRRSWASRGWRAGSRSCCSPSPSWIPCPLPPSRPGPRCEAGSRRPGRAAVSDRPPPAPGPASRPVRNLDPQSPILWEEENPLLQVVGFCPLSLPSSGLSNPCYNPRRPRSVCRGWGRLGWDALCEDAGSPASWGSPLQVS